MRWDKLKAVLIVILAAANIFLAVTLVSLCGKNENSASVAAEERMIAVLEDDGIFIDRSVKLPESDIAPVYECDVESDAVPAAVKRFAADSEILLDYYSGNDHIIVAENENRFVIGNGGRFEYVKMNMESIISDVRNESADGEDAPDEATADIALKLAELFVCGSADNGSDELSYSVSVDSLKYYKESECFAATITQHIVTSGGETESLTGNTVECILKDGEMIYAGGRWLFAGVSVRRSAQKAPFVNILLSVKKSVGALRASGKAPDSVRIVSVDNTYCVYYGADDTKAYLVPGIKIHLDNGAVLVFNSLNGEVG